MIEKILRAYRLNVPLEQLLHLKMHPYPCISIKNSRREYCYADANFVRLMGRQSLSDVLKHQDKDLTNNKALLKTILLHDEEILDAGNILTVSETLYPNQGAYCKKVQGHIYPVFQSEEGRPEYILGVFYPSSQLLYLDLSTLLKTDLNTLFAHLNQKSYSISWEGRLIQLSRREIQIIITTLRGKHAGEVAKFFGIQQTTVESYIRHIKDKLSLSLKSELFSAVLEGQLLDQILLS